MTGQHVFISHSSEDDHVVSEIRAALQGLGMGVWTDSWRLAGGEELAPKIQRAIKDARHFVAVLSTNAVNSRWVAKEVRQALEVQQEREDGFKVIPLLMPGIEPSALPLWFDDDPVAAQIRVGAGGAQRALGDLLAALDDRAVAARGLTIEKDVAELVLELTDPALEAGGRNLTAVAMLRFQPTDSEEMVESKRFPFKLDLGPFDDAELTWYLERYARWPSPPFQERARRLEQRLPEWGHRLFEAMGHEAAAAALDAWRSVDREIDRRLTVLVDPELIEGATAERQAAADLAAHKILSLPWELVQAERGHPFQRARAVRVRRPPRQPEKNLAPSDPPLRVLLLSPRPEDEQVSYIDHRRIAAPLVETLSRLGELAQLTLAAPSTLAALEDELKRATEARTGYHVAHIDAVAKIVAGVPTLFFENPADVARLGPRRSSAIAADQLAALLHAHNVPLVVLQATPSSTGEAIEDPTAAVAAHLLQGGVSSVLVLSRSTLTETRRRFFTVLFGELMAGARISGAVLAGQRELKSDTYRGDAFDGELHLQDWLIPVLYQTKLDPQLVTGVSQQRIEQVLQRPRAQWLGDLPPPPPHGFFGRGRELLEAERLLERHSYLVLRGEPGEGKTTFAGELVRWLTAGQHLQRAAYVRLQMDSSSRSVHLSLGEQLVPKFHLAVSQSQRLAVQLIERVLADQPTLLVFDDVESILPPPPEERDDDAIERAFEPRALEQILALAHHLGRIGRTRLLFISRESLPEPFAEHELRLGGLDRDASIELVAGVLALADDAPRALDPDGQIDGAMSLTSEVLEAALTELHEATGGHCRALTLAAGEIVERGIVDAPPGIAKRRQALQERVADERRVAALLAVELSLRRLTREERERLRPLAVFQGGGHITAISTVLDLNIEEDEEVALAEQLIDVGLAEMLPFNAMRLHPGLATVLRAELSDAEWTAAHNAWIDAMIELANFLDQQQIKDPKLSSTLTVLELPNLLAMLEELQRRADPERVVEVAGILERLVEVLPRPEALARIESLRAVATEQLGEWSHGRYQADSSMVEQLLESKRTAEAVAAARALLQRAEASGDEAYDEASFDLAMAYFLLGRALLASADAEHALAPFDEARRRFRGLADAADADSPHYAEHQRMLVVSSAEAGDCLRALDRPDAAAEAYETAIAVAEKLDNSERVAAVTVRLGELELALGYPLEALASFERARSIFEKLEDADAVADTWHRIAAVQEREMDYDAAELSYHEALKIEVQGDRRAVAASTLAEIAGLYDTMWRLEDAMSYYQQAADLFRELGDLPKEGIARSNIADKLTKLGRYDEARGEILRTIECEAPFGHEAEPWRTFSMLANLEREAQNEDAAQSARSRALEAYLAYRRDGGASQIGHHEIFDEVRRAILSCELEAITAQLAGMLERPDLPKPLKALLPALQAVLEGSRDRSLVERNPDLYYRDAAELHLLLDALETPSDPGDGA